MHSISLEELTVLLTLEFSAVQEPRISKEFDVIVRKLSVLLFVIAAGLALSWPTVTMAADPPPVQSGSAKSNCERITEAGFSPHDYVLVVSRYNTFTIKDVDYFHVVYNHLPALIQGQPLSLALALISQQGNGPVAPGTEEVEGYATTEHESEGTSYRSNGVLRNGNGQPIPVGQDEVQPGDTGNLDEYTWTPDGGNPITYRDQTSTGVSAETTWVYDPEWSGPDDARMSSIWGATPACAA